MDKHDPESAIESVTLQIGGMDCTCNADLLARKLDALTSIRGHEITPVTSQARVSYNPSIVSIHDIEAAVKKAGVTAIPVKSK